MSDFYKFGKELRDLLSGLLAIDIEREKVRKSQIKSFEDNFFYGEINKFTGSGGEILIKGLKNKNNSPTLIEIGDRLIGIGITHFVESLSRPSGPNAFRSLFEDDIERKMALRAFEVSHKERVEGGFEFALSPLTPNEYSELVNMVSDGLVSIPAESIPKGTMVISFLDSKSTYSLQKVSGSPATNWRDATKGVRHWNVGIGKEDDFWRANFPSDDIGLLTQIPSSVKVGTIQFGLSLLSNSRETTNFKPVSFPDPTGRTTTHQFCLSGSAVGTQGLDTPFPIGLRTEIVFHPENS